MTKCNSQRRIFATAPLWLLAVILFSAAWSRADDPPAPRHRMENRFLFVIDTSSAMKARTNGVEQAVNELLASGMEGELRKGDTIGLWTYNDRLDTDFPMEVWSEEGKEGILKEVRAHLGHVRYEKHAHLEKALPAILQVVAGSERLTIILIFDGYDLIKGTSFDKDINALHKRYAGEFRSASKPFVTILAAHYGAVFDYTINYPGSLMVPHTADPLPPPETNAPPVAAASAPPPEGQAPPPSVAPNPPPVELAPPTPARIQIVLSGSDFAHHTSAPPPTNNNVVAVVTPTPVPVAAVVSNAPPPAEPAPVAGQAAPANVAPPEPQRALSSAAIVANFAKSNAVAPTSVPRRSTPVPVSPAVVAATTGQLAVMFIIAVSLLTIAVALVLILLRRWRGGPQPSLISQSIDRSR